MRGIRRLDYSYSYFIRSYAHSSNSCDVASEALLKIAERTRKLHPPHAKTIRRNGYTDINIRGRAIMIGQRKIPWAQPSLHIAVLIIGPNERGDERISLVYVSSAKWNFKGTNNWYGLQWGWVIVD